MDWTAFPSPHPLKVWKMFSYVIHMCINVVGGWEIFSL